jgi:hypothetical protein
VLPPPNSVALIVAIVSGDSILPILIVRNREQRQIALNVGSLTGSSKTHQAAHTNLFCLPSAHEIKARIQRGILCLLIPATVRQVQRMNGTIDPVCLHRIIAAHFLIAVVRIDPNRKTEGIWIKLLKSQAVTQKINFDPGSTNPRLQDLNAV